MVHLTSSIDYTRVFNMILLGSPSKLGK